MRSFFQENQELLKETVQDEKTLSIYNLIMDGGLGGQIIIAILFVLLAIALNIYFERFFAIKSASKEDENFMNQIREYVSDGKLEAANSL
ncbi:MAG: biopolymer transport protein ExbB, partial [Polaribacter sp.]